MKEGFIDTDGVNLFWTGGWDSTFQLLWFIIEQNVGVTPYYLIDEERRSTNIELLTIKRIKTLFYEKLSDARNLLHATQFYAVGDIAPNSDISAAYERLRDKSSLGSQYDWMARYCEEKGIRNVQLALEKARSSKAYHLLKEKVTEYNSGKFTYFKVMDNLKETDEFNVFKYYSFPIFHLTKLDMVRIAKKWGMLDILNLTWFCHNPIRGKPCGKCNPCNSVIEEGLGWRISPTRRIYSKFARSVESPIKRYVKQMVVKAIR